MDSGVFLGYIGPGAGIALLGSFFTVLAAFASTLLAMVTWPVRRLWFIIRGRKAYKRARMKRVVIVGLDGLEPSLVEQYMEDGLLPNLARLRDRGSYTRLGTTYPPLSPVAWSSFSTGTNPGKHNIFDFLDRRHSDYRPVVSSVRIEGAPRTLRLGRWTIPLGRPVITGLRRSKPFWSVLGEAGVFSAVLRVPITFPPDTFHGVQLSAMCVPDLLGTHGTFFRYREDGDGSATGGGDQEGRLLGVTRTGAVVRGELRGPPNPVRRDQAEMRLPFRIDSARGGPRIRIGGRTFALPLGGYTEWIPVTFRAAPGVKVRGVCRFYLRSLEPPFDLYCTPIQIDPARPVMPISHPALYATYLSRLLGTYSTLGLAEDTWGLSEGALTEDAFLRQAYDIHDERERMLFDAIDRVRRGTVICVFDGPDRIQHMFWRFIDENHPALNGAPNTHPDAIRDMYVKMDETVGRIVDRLDEDTALFVLSDHGFKPFRRCVDLNAWLRANGYLALKDDAAASDTVYLADVDWTRTRAYAIGLAGLFINRRGREAQGIVASGKESRALAEEIASRLTGLRDGERTAIHEAVPSHAAYRGPYVDGAPDVIVGYDVGYRVSWETAVGKCSAAVFSDNTKAWSGDHCIHPDLVPGVLFSSIETKTEAANIIDLAPTALELLGVDRPHYMDGQSLLCDERSVPAS